jgi:uncharacterized protein (DUF2164 family)
MAIRPTDDITVRLRTSIKRFVAEELGEDIGDLKAGTILDFCLKEVAPTVYNEAIADARAYMAGRLDDLEGVCHVQEFSYWPPDQRR